MADPDTSPVNSPTQNGHAVEPVPDQGITTSPSPDETANDKTSERVVSGLDSTTATSFTAIAQRCTDTALDFLAHASNETLGACLVGLSATTYLVLGRVGLVIIGVAGGVVLHATWEGSRHEDRDAAAKALVQERRRETGLDVVKRVLQWRQQDGGTLEGEETRVIADRALDFKSFEPDTAAALNTLTEAVIKDYVKYWYEPTIPGEETFPTMCRRTLTAFLLSVSGHLRRKRPTDAFLDFVTNASSIIVVFLGELSRALNASPNSSAEEAVETYLKLKPDSSLASLLDRDNQDRKLKMIAEDILEAYLDPKSFNCPPVYIFLKEILAQLCLGHTITLCSAPDWINDWIIYGLEESDTTKEVMNIVDAGVEGKGVKTTKQDSARLEEIAKDDVTLTAPAEHKRQPSRAEEAMDEAMREAKRLTQLMIEEDERRAREESKRNSMATSTGDVSDAGPSHGLVTPTSSESERDKQEIEQHEEAVEETTAEVSEVAEQKPVTPTTSQQFTSFDQILPSSQPTALASPEKSRKEQPSLTLHNASMSIFDDSMPGEKASIKAKPTTDYLIQIEPAGGLFPGWMIARKYADFEMLHEVLRRISVITGTKFTESHAELPKWKVHTKASLRQELERYLMDAVHFQPLAESEGMKRFLEKDQALMVKGPSKGLGWPTPDAFGKFGGDMINALAKAPNNVAGGGKALFGGLKGKKNQSQTSIARTNTNGTSTPQIGTPGTERLSMSFGDAAEAISAQSTRFSQDSIRPASRNGESAVSEPPLVEEDMPPTPAKRPTGLIRVESYSSQVSPTRSEMPLDPITGIADTIELPPPPSEMPDDYGVAGAARISIDALRPPQVNDSVRASFDEPPAMPPRPIKPTQKKPPINERETSVAIELMFAVITELYTLSSAWQFRRTLLAAAKSFLLRPGNPQLGAIKDLLQNDLLDANLSDAGIAALVLKLRENALPTEEEMEIWKRDYPEKTPEQKEAARIKARKLLVTKGMPTALMSVMGAAASGEALGNVFDCLQVPQISRGLIFGLMLQALKVVTH